MQLMLLAAMCRHPASGFWCLGDFRTEGNIKKTPKVHVEGLAKCYCGASSQPATVEADLPRKEETLVALLILHWNTFNGIAYSIKFLHV